MNSPITLVEGAELQAVAEQFRIAQEQADHRLFVSPSTDEVVRLVHKAARFTRKYGWLSPAAARARVQQWKDRVRLQSAADNGNRVVLSLFDHTGNWSRPWEEAGYHVVRFDIQDNPELGDVNAFSVEFFSEWFADFEGLDVYAVLAACPCTEFAGSGARHFAAKDADGRTSAAVDLVHQTLRTVEYFRPPVWAIENPVGRIERLTGLPPWRLAFDPNHFGDTYTKKTLLWGRFNADLPVSPVQPTEGSKMHTRYGGRSIATKNARSATPEGFSYGFFLANNALDNPALALSGKFDRIPLRIFREAVAAGLGVEEIEDEISDLYYMDLDDDAAVAAIWAAQSALVRQTGSFR